MNGIFLCLWLVLQPIAHPYQGEILGWSSPLARQVILMVDHRGVIVGWREIQPDDYSGRKKMETL